MKLFVMLAYFALVALSAAQDRMTVVPDLIIFHSTNKEAPLNIVSVSCESGRTDYVNKQSVMTNLSLTAMSAKSLTVTQDKDVVSLTFRDLTRYEPAAAAPEKLEISDLKYVKDKTYVKDKKLSLQYIRELSIGMGKGDLIQINNEILTAHRFAEKFKALPEK